MKKARGQDWMIKHRTKQEIKAHITETQRTLDKRISNMNERINAMTARIRNTINEEMLAKRFKEGDKIEQYEWNYEYSFHLGRRCFASDSLLIPGSKAYKGTFVVGRIIDNSSGLGIVYPEEIWLTKEEFTIRRLKGQI